MGNVMDSFTEIKDLTTISSVLIGAASLAFAAVNTRLTARTNRARFWLDLRSAFGRHDEIHRKLHPRGDWATGRRPPTADEQFQVEAYMGLFEHCEIMLEKGLLDEQTFREIYRYRLVNLVGNEWIRIEKLCIRSGGWKRLIALLGRMDVEFDCRPKDEESAGKSDFTEANSTT
jgi:hypothetical protein